MLKISSPSGDAIKAHSTTGINTLPGKAIERIASRTMNIGAGIVAALFDVFNSDVRMLPFQRLRTTARKLAHL
jgi:hypothetical protein